MDIGGELPPAVGVAEEVADYGEDGTKGLEGDVPAGADDLGPVRSRMWGEGKENVRRGPCQWGR